MEIEFRGLRGIPAVVVVGPRVAHGGVHFAVATRHRRVVAAIRYYDRRAVGQCVSSSVVSSVH